MGCNELLIQKAILHFFFLNQIRALIKGDWRLNILRSSLARKKAICNKDYWNVHWFLDISTLSCENHKQVCGHKFITILWRPCDKQKQVCDHKFITRGWTVLWWRHRLFYTMVKVRPFCWWCCVCCCIVVLTLRIHYFTSPPWPQQNCPLWDN